MSQKIVFGNKPAVSGIRGLEGYWVADVPANQCRLRGYRGAPQVAITDFSDGERWVQEAAGQPVYRRDRDGMWFRGNEPYIDDRTWEVPSLSVGLLYRQLEFEDRVTNLALDDAPPPAPPKMASVIPSNEWSPGRVWRTDEPRPAQFPSDTYGKPVEVEVTIDDPQDGELACLLLVGTSDAKFAVNARALHQALEVGKDFSNWIKDRLDKFQLVENKEYAVCSPNLASKECGVVGRGGHNAKDYLLTLTAARLLAADVNSERGRQVIRFLVSRHERLEQIESRPASSLDLSTPAGLRALLVELSTNSLQLAEKNQQLQLENTLVAGAARAAEGRALAQAGQAAIEEEAATLTEWLDHTEQRHGHGEKVGMKVMRALRLLHKEKVPNCRSSEVNRFCSDMNPYLVYSKITEVEKTKIRNKGTPDELVELVTDGEGKAVILPCNTIMVRKAGEAWLMNWFMTRPECALRRMVGLAKLVRGHDVMRRLRGRYSFMEGDKHAWDELTDSEYQQGVRLNHTEEGWSAWCFRGERRVTGTGLTVEAALLKLAQNYRTERQKK